MGYRYSLMSAGFLEHISLIQMGFLIVSFSYPVARKSITTNLECFIKMS